jgi:hypothetical protein
MLNSLSLKLVSPKTVLALNIIMIVASAWVLLQMPSSIAPSLRHLFPFLAPALTIYSFVIKPPSKILARIALAINIFVVLAGIGFIFMSAAFATQSIFGFWPVLVFFIFIPLVSALSLWGVGLKSGR